MHITPLRFAASLVLGIAAMGQPRTASAQTVLVEREDVHRVTYAPNGSLLWSGIFVSALTYVPSVIVAGQSSNDADHHLYVPVAGPWIDLANRSPCPPGYAGCDKETANKILLVGDGILQAAGALQILSAFIFPEVREVTTVHAGSTTITLSPGRVGGGYGVGGVIRF